MTKTLTTLQKNHRFHLVENLDENTWNEIESFISQKKINAYEAQLKPMTIEEMRERLEASKKAFQEGRFHSLEEVEALSENW